MVFMFEKIPFWVASSLVPRQRSPSGRVNPMSGVRLSGDLRLADPQCENDTNQKMEQAKYFSDPP